MINPFKKMYTADTELQKIQDYIYGAFQELYKNSPILSGNVLADVDLIAGGLDNTLEHGLQRNINGWIVLRKSAAADIYESGSINKDSKKWLILKSSANCRVTLYIF
jgi:hypothetical protein